MKILVLGSGDEGGQSPDLPLSSFCRAGEWIVSPWAPPGSVFPCPSSVPGRPGQRRPPPPPPPTLPPPPPLPPLPPPPLKKRRDHNTGLCLLVMFFMVLVALVGLGLGIFQLFHLQKELAELREVSCLGDCRALKVRGGGMG